MNKSLQIGDTVEVTVPGGRKMVQKIVQFHPAPPYWDWFMVHRYFWWFHPDEARLIKEKENER